MCAVIEGEVCYNKWIGDSANKRGRRTQGATLERAFNRWNERSSDSRAYGREDREKN